jgi:hypothetical protein
VLQTQAKKDRDSIAALTTQGKKDVDEIVALKKRIAELETLLKQANGEYIILFYALSYTRSDILLPCTPYQTNMLP